MSDYELTRMDIESFYRAIINNNQAPVRYHLKFGFPIKDDLDHPIRLAAEHCHLDMVLLLLENGANPFVRGFIEADKCAVISAIDYHANAIIDYFESTSLLNEVERTKIAHYKNKEAEKYEQRIKLLNSIKQQSPELFK